MEKSQESSSRVGKESDWTMDSDPDSESESDRSEECEDENHAGSSITMRSMPSKNNGPDVGDTEAASDSDSDSSDADSESSDGESDQKVKPIKSSNEIKLPKIDEAKPQRVPNSNGQQQIIKNATEGQRQLSGIPSIKPVLSSSKGGTSKKVPLTTALPAQGRKNQKGEPLSPRIVGQKRGGENGKENYKSNESENRSQLKHGKTSPRTSQNVGSLRTTYVKNSPGPSNAKGSPGNPSHPPVNSKASRQSVNSVSKEKADGPISSSKTSRRFSVSTVENPTKAGELSHSASPRRERRRSSLLPPGNSKNVGVRPEKSPTSPVRKTGLKTSENSKNVGVVPRKSATSSGRRTSLLASEISKNVGVTSWKAPTSSGRRASPQASENSKNIVPRKSAVSPVPKSSSLLPGKSKKDMTVSGKVNSSNVRESGRPDCQVNEANDENITSGSESDEENEGSESEDNIQKKTEADDPLSTDKKVPGNLGKGGFNSKGKSNNILTRHGAIQKSPQPSRLPSNKAVASSSTAQRVPNSASGKEHVKQSPRVQVKGKNGETAAGATRQDAQSGSESSSSEDESESDEGSEETSGESESGGSEDNRVDSVLLAKVKRNIPAVELVKIRSNALNDGRTRNNLTKQLNIIEKNQTGGVSPKTRMSLQTSENKKSDTLLSVKRGKQERSRLSVSRSSSIRPRGSVNKSPDLKGIQKDRAEINLGGKETLDSGGQEPQARARSNSGGNDDVETNESETSESENSESETISGESEESESESSGSSSEPQLSRNSASVKESLSVNQEKSQSSSASTQLSTKASVQPRRNPSIQLSRSPSDLLSRRPSINLSRRPSGTMSRRPSVPLIRRPSSQLSRKPNSPLSTRPSGQLSRKPSGQLSRRPSGQLSRRPSGQLSRKPSGSPSDELGPMRRPSVQLSRSPSDLQSRRPSLPLQRSPSDLLSRQNSGQLANSQLLVRRPSVQSTKTKYSSVGDFRNTVTANRAKDPHLKSRSSSVSPIIKSRSSSTSLTPRSSSLGKRTPSGLDDYISEDKEFDGESLLDGSLLSSKLEASLDSGDSSSSTEGKGDGKQKQFSQSQQEHGVPQNVLESSDSGTSDTDESESSSSETLESESSAETSKTMDVATKQLFDILATPRSPRVSTDRKIDMHLWTPSFRPTDSKKVQQRLGSPATYNQDTDSILGVPVSEFDGSEVNADNSSLKNEENHERGDENEHDAIDDEGDDEENEDSDDDDDDIEDDDEEDDDDEDNDEVSDSEEDSDSTDSGEEDDSSPGTPSIAHTKNNRESPKRNVNRNRLSVPGLPSRRSSTLSSASDRSPLISRRSSVSQRSYRNTPAAYPSNRGKLEGRKQSFSSISTTASNTKLAGKKSRTGLRHEELSSRANGTTSRSKMSRRNSLAVSAKPKTPLTSRSSIAGSATSPRMSRRNSQAVSAKPKTPLTGRSSIAGSTTSPRMSRRNSQAVSPKTPLTARSRSSSIAVSTTSPRRTSSVALSPSRQGSNVNLGKTGPRLSMGISKQNQIDDASGNHKARNSALSRQNERKMSLLKNSSRSSLSGYPGNSVPTQKQGLPLRQTSAMTSRRASQISERRQSQILNPNQLRTKLSRLQKGVVSNSGAVDSVSSEYGSKTSSPKPRSRRTSLYQSRTRSSSLRSGKLNSGRRNSVSPDSRRKMPSRSGLQNSTQKQSQNQQQGKITRQGDSLLGSARNLSTPTNPRGLNSPRSMNRRTSRLNSTVSDTSRSAPNGTALTSLSPKNFVNSRVSSRSASVASLKSASAKEALTANLSSRTLTPNPTDIFISQEGSNDLIQVSPPDLTDTIPVAPPSDVISKSYIKVLNTFTGRTYLSDGRLLPQRNVFDQRPCKKRAPLFLMIKVCQMLFVWKKD